MKIKKLHIKNFKSIADLEIIEPNPFTVFVGPNGSGKSNIFEALEFITFSHRFMGNFELTSFPKSVDPSFINSIFGDTNSIHVKETNSSFLDGSVINLSNGARIFQGALNSGLRPDDGGFYDFESDKLIRQFVKNFSVIFPKNKERERYVLRDDRQLSLSTSNLETVLDRILKEEFKKEELLDWLELFIPEFEDIFIENNRNNSTLIVREKFADKDFTKDLLSDGTYNILALLTAVFQSDEPQFLCIEEPENGLTPYVIREMVTLFRNACEEKGHYIWLNTHSQSLVSELTPGEIITVNKIKGETKIKQFKGKDFHGLRMDEAWLTNTLGGGLPW